MSGSGDESSIGETRVADPYSFDMDPDPAF